MLLIPFLLLMFCKWYEDIDVWPVIKSFGQNGEIWIALIGLCAYGLIFLLYYIDCVYLSNYWNFKPVLSSFTTSQNSPFVQFLEFFYLFGVRTLLEEFFWRTYCYKIIYENEFYYIFVSLCASIPYAYTALRWYTWIEMLGVSITYIIYARIAIIMRKHFD